MRSLKVMPHSIRVVELIAVWSDTGRQRDRASNNHEGSKFRPIALQRTLIKPVLENRSDARLCGASGAYLFAMGDNFKPEY